MIVPACATAAGAVYDPPVGSHWEIKSNRQDDRTADHASTTVMTKTTSELAVLEKSAAGFRMSHTLRSCEVQGAQRDLPLSAAGATKSLCEAFVGVEVLLRTNPDGKPIEVENPGDVMAAYNTALASAFKVVGGGAAARSLSEAALKRAAPDAVDLAVDGYILDLYLLATAQSGTRARITPGTEARFTELSANPFGEGSTKINAIVRFGEIDTAKDAQSITRDWTYDPEAVNAAKIAVLAKLAPNAAPAELQRMANLVEFSYEGHAEVTNERGMARAVRWDTTMSSKVENQVIKSSHLHTELIVGGPR